MSDPDKKKSLPELKKTGFGLITVVIFLVLTEIVFRITGVFPAERLFEKDESSESWQENLFASFMGIHQPDPVLLWKMRPSLNKSFMQTNSRGLTGALVPYEKDTAKLRILLLGDSTPLGIGLEKWENGFPWLLQKWLRERLNRDVELINASTAGYSTLQGLIYLKTKGLKYKPDIVLMYLGNNDASYNGCLSDSALIAQAEKFIGAKKLLNNLRLYRFLKTILLPLKSGGNDSEGTGLQVRVSPGMFEEDIKDIIELCRENGSMVLLNTIPVPLTWPPGVEFKVFTSGRDSASGQLYMPDSQREMLESKMSLILDWDMFTSQYGRIDPWSEHVLKSAYSDSGDIADNITRYHNLIKKDTSDVISWNNLGVLFRNENIFDSALYFLSRAKILGPENPTVLYNLGMTYRAMSVADSSEFYLNSARDNDFNSLRIKTNYNDIIRKTAGEENVPIVDLADIFSRDISRESLFVDHCHPNPRGHILIARTLGEKILEMMVKSD